jgi:hypothetical protein
MLFWLGGGLSDGGSKKRAKAFLLWQTDRPRRQAHFTEKKKADPQHRFKQ